MDNQPLTESAKYHNTLVVRAQEILRDPASSASYRRAATALLRHEGVPAPVEGETADVSRVPAQDMWASQPTTPQDPWESIAPAPQPIVDQAPVQKQEEKLISNGGLLLGVEDPLDFALTPASKPEVTPVPTPEVAPASETLPDERVTISQEVHVPIQQVVQDSAPLIAPKPQAIPPSPRPTNEEVAVAPVKEEEVHSIRDRLNAFLGKRHKKDELFGGIGKVSEMVAPSTPPNEEQGVAEVVQVSATIATVPDKEADMPANTLSAESVATEIADAWELVTPKVSAPHTMATGPIDEPTPQIEREESREPVDVVTAPVLAPAPIEIPPMVVEESVQRVLPSASDDSELRRLRERSALENNKYSYGTAIQGDGTTEQFVTDGIVPKAILPAMHEVLDDVSMEHPETREEESVSFEATPSPSEDASLPKEAETPERSALRPEGIAMYRAMLAMLDEFSPDPQALDARQQVLRESVVTALEQAEADIGVVLTQSTIVQGWADLLAQSAEVSEGDEIALKRCMVEEVDRIARTEVTGGEEPDAEVLWGVWRALTGKSHEHIPESFTDAPALLHEVEQDLLTRLRREEHR